MGSKTMKTPLALGLLLGVAAFAGAQDVTSINSARVSARVFNDDVDSTFTSVNNYPASVVLSDLNVDGDSDGGFANRHLWEMSADGGTTSFLFGNDTFFATSMDVNISLPSGASNTPRKEAGYILRTQIGGEGQFIVNSDAGEVVAFGGPLPFYSFNASNGLSYTTGTTIRLGMTYFLDPIDNLRKVIYSANGVNSPALAFTNTEQGIIGNATLGGYVQVPIAPNDPSNGVIGTFSNVTITPVPEPATMAALGLGALALLKRRRSSSK